MNTDKNMARDFAAEYIAARIEVRSASTLAEREVAARKANRIASQAGRAGIALDELDLDEVARKRLFG